MSSVYGASSTASSIQYLQSLLAAGPANSSQQSSAKKDGSFDPLTTLGDTASAPSGSGPRPPFDLGAMSALIDAQEQSGASGLSPHQQRVFGKLDADGDGTVTGAELKSAFGSENAGIADYVMSKLDKDGDGSISQAEFRAGTTRGGHHHHGHAGSAGEKSGLDALMAATQGAGSTSTGNSDGSTTTTITYADGSKVSMTSAVPATGADNSTSVKSNLLEQLIKLQAQLTAPVAATSATTA